MFAYSIKKIRKATFPIFRFEQISPTQANIGVAGTGFFVNSKGYFVSVAHAFDNKTAATKFMFIGCIPESALPSQLEIEEIARDDQNDIFIGRVNKKTQNFLSLSKKIPDIGKSVCITGYPLAQITVNAQGALDVSNVRPYFQPSFVLDYMRASIGGSTRIHDGFLVRDFGLFGMSGGPVFDTGGMVMGMQASVTNPRVSTNGTRSISVENALAVKSSIILDLLKTNGIQIERNRD